VDALLHVPILVLVAFSFNDSKFSAGWVGFTLDWCCRLLERSDILRGFKAGLIVGGASIAIRVVLGALVALALARYRSPGRTYGMARRNIEPSINAIRSIILPATTALIYLADQPAREQ